jgi:hypothetical protein
MSVIRRSSRISYAAMGGTSVQYIVERLQRNGRPDLARAIISGRISAYSIAVALGWQRRKAIVGTGSMNESKRRAYRLRALGL